jgi:predicted TIM-barrel fold metal-dependent hydrolase
MANLVSLIETGVPERFPGLRIGFTESGLSWVPFIMNRLDKEYIEHRREMHYLRNRPSQYIKRFYFATQPLEEPEDPSDMAKLIEIYGGEDTTMFASDWPHHDFDHPRLAYQLPFTTPVRRKIMGENALNFFRMDAAGQRLKLKTG